MNLLVLPGGGNPDASPLYAKVYSVISREAKKHGYDDVFTDIRWPGHTLAANDTSSESLTLSGAVVVARKKISGLPDVPFAILARSFGCVVALKLANLGFPAERCPSRIILWGPPPYWLIWQMFARDLQSNQAIAKSKGLKLDERFQATTEPIESLIASMRIPTVVAAGTEDPYCTPAYLEYLRALTAGNRFVTCRVAVPGAPHEVTDDNGEKVVRGYVETLFRE